MPFTSVAENDLLITNPKIDVDFISDIFIFHHSSISDNFYKFLISKINLTRKQYYSRLNSLTRSGLIRKEKRKHFLTSFGKIVYDAQKIVDYSLIISYRSLSKGQRYGNSHAL